MHPARMLESIGRISPFWMFFPRMQRIASLRDMFAVRTIAVISEQVRDAAHQRYVALQGTAARRLIVEMMSVALEKIAKRVHRTALQGMRSAAAERHIIQILMNAAQGQFTTLTYKSAAQEMFTQVTVVVVNALQERSA